MGRPDLTEIRTAEILDAFERCVARDGLHGSSLESVAEEAGMKRSVVRHYMGNRDEMIEALAGRAVQSANRFTSAFASSVTPQKRIEELLEFLFPNDPVGNADSLLVIESLIAQGESHPRVRELMTQYVADFVKFVADQLRLALPETNPAQCWNVAYGIVGICYNHSSLQPLGLSNKYERAAKSSARALIESLEV